MAAIGQVYPEAVQCDAYVSDIVEYIDFSQWLEINRAHLRRVYVQWDHRTMIFALLIHV